MTFLPNVPQPGDNFAQSQGDFLNNFMSLYAAFAANHVPLDAASNAGNHTIAQMFKQPGPLQTNLDELSVYCKYVGDDSDQIFLNFPGPATDIQYTLYQIYPLEQTPTQTSYFSFLPGRLMVFFGWVQTSGSQTTVYLNPPIAKNIIIADCCPYNAYGNKPVVTLPSKNGNGFYTSFYLNKSKNPTASQHNFFVLANV